MRREQELRTSTNAFVLVLHQLSQGTVQDVRAGRLDRPVQAVRVLRLARCVRRDDSPTTEHATGLEVLLCVTLPAAEGSLPAVEGRESLPEAAVARNPGELCATCPGDCETACYHCLLDYGNQAQHGLLDRNLARDPLDFALTGAEPDLSRERQLAALERLSYFAEEGTLVLNAETNSLHLPGLLTLPGQTSYGLLPIHTLREPTRDAAPPGIQRSEIVPLFPSEFDLVRRPFWVWGRILEGRAGTSVH